MEREWVWCFQPIRACENIGFQKRCSNIELVLFYFPLCFFLLYLLELNDKKNKMG